MKHAAVRRWVAPRDCTVAISGTVAHAGLEQSDFQYLARQPENDSTGTIRIAYAGTVSRESTFVLFVRALAAIRARLPRPVSLEIFSSHSYHDQPWFDAAWMHMRGNLPEPQLTSALRECQWGFAPMSLAEDDPRHRFALPTKFVSYLAAGLPIITLGHPESSVVKMARAHEVGLCLATGDVGILSEKLFTALAGENPKTKFRAGIETCAAKEFDARQMRAALYESLQKCAAVTHAG